MKKLSNVWESIWFKPDDSLQLDVVRFLIGFLLLINYASLSPYLFDLYGQAGWVELSVVEQKVNNPWVISMHFWMSEPWQFMLFHCGFLAACLSFTLGYKTSWVKWLVLFGHLSYIHRNPAITYGVDNILASILLILCLARTGQNFSIDKLRENYNSKLQDLNAVLAPRFSAWNFACIRLLQLQMVVLYFFSAVEKLRGETWWSGDALWLALNNFEFTNVPVTLLAEYYWIANGLTYLTLLIEIAYAFLIWGRPTRPYFLVAALLLHLGIGVLMGLYLFAAVMAAGHLAFLRSEWILSCLSFWRKKVGSISMYYDGKCGFCKRSMAWLLSFDGANQIQAFDYHHKPLSLVSTSDHEQALYTETSHGKALPGFSAYRYVVNRVPGLWWLMPLFNIPFLSHNIGSRLYQYVAQRRYLFSQYLFKKSNS